MEKSYNLGFPVNLCTLPLTAESDYINGEQHLLNPTSPIE